MSEQDSAEKTEKATSHKVREARKKGMVAKSLDISSLLIMAAGLLLMYAIGESLIMRSFLLGREIFLKAGRLDFQIENLMQWIEWVFSQGLFILAAYVAPLMLVAVLSSWLQTGPVFSVFSLKPNFKKLNPVEGFKRIFSTRLLVELVKSLLKISIFGTAIYFTYMEYMPAYMGLMNRSSNAYPGIFLSTAGVLIFRILLSLVLIAFVDLLFSRWDYQKKLRMSKKELKDEHKRYEGDPLIRQKRREIAKELLGRSKSPGNVASADVVSARDHKPV